MMFNKLLITLIPIFFISCKTLNREIKIEQINNNDEISIKFKDFRYDAVVSIPISFKVENNTSESRYFNNYYFDYNVNFEGLSWIII